MGGGQKFRVTEDHVKLLSRAIVSWDHCEFGAPSIDCKRPYGNSDVLNDIADILNVKLKKDEDGEYIVSDKQEDKFRKLHKETETVLQIVLSTGKLEEGLYKATSYFTWEKVKE